jgi:hypothetical protein
MVFLRRLQRERINCFINLESGIKNPAAALEDTFQTRRKRKA